MTPRELSAPQLAALAALIERHLGLHFGPHRHADLARGIAGASCELGFPDVAAGADWLLHATLRQSQIELLASHLTIGETYFFREPKTFAALEERVLPELLRARRAGSRRLRVWSAGCASGEEAYSLAITLHRALPDLAEWSVSILGTDINPHALRRAEAGIYSEWSFRATPPGVQQRYFEKLDERRYAIVPAIRAMARFAFLNLAEASYPALLNGTSAIDLLFCRNVLLYFPPDKSARVVERFGAALAEGGWLIGGLAEPFRAPGLVTVPFDGGTLFRKAAAAPPAIAPPTARATPAPAPLALPAPPRVLSLPPAARPASAAELAHASAGRGDIAAALRHCDVALAGEKLNPALHHLRATILREQGAAAEAERALRRALFLDPDFALAHFALGTLLGQSGRPRDSARHFDHALALLQNLDPAAIVPESDGLTAGRLAEMIRQTRNARL